MSKEKKSFKNFLKRVWSDRLTKYATITGMAALGLVTWKMGIGFFSTITGLTLLGSSAFLFGRALDKERKAGINEGQAKAVARQKMKERVREARERGDKLAYKSAVLDLASAPERETREKEVALAEKVRIPLSAKEVMRLRKKEENKRLDVNAELIKGGMDR